MNRNNNGNIKNMNDQFWDGFNQDWSSNKKPKATIFPVKTEPDQSSKIRDLQDKILSLTTENIKLKQDTKSLDRIKTENERRKTENDLYKIEIERIKIENNGYEKTVSMLSVEDNKNKTKINSLEKLIKTLQASLENKDKTISILKSDQKAVELTERETNLKLKEEKLTKLEEELKTIIKDLEESHTTDEICIQTNETIKKDDPTFTLTDKLDQFNEKLNLISSIESGETISTKNMTKMVHSSWSTAFWRKYYGEGRNDLIDWINSLFDDIIAFKKQLDDPEFKKKVKTVIYRMYDASENLKNLKETYDNDTIFKEKIDQIYKKSTDFFSELDESE